ncbi:MAG: 50S ribosomal protein L18 [Hyphomicrobiales bacterium]|nr:50S ribosomal protein L18 [Hyphomicrobiales bacterium]
MAKSNQSMERRQARVRRAIRAHAGGRPRLSVFRSSKQISAQIIDDEKGVTLVAASTLEKTFREALKTGADVEAAKRIGLELAERAKKAGVDKVVFDRGRYMYHGRVKALAEGAREGGLDF